MTRPVFCMACALLFGCSSGGAPIEPSSLSGVDGATAGGGDGGGQTVSDGGAPPADLAPPVTGYGTVFIYLNHISSATFDAKSTTVGATFFEVSPPATTTATCTTSTISECVVTSCSGLTTTTPPPTPVEPAAGNVTISGPGHSVTLHNPANSHETVSTQALYWTGGESLSISSTGATVGAFSDTLVAPNQIVVINPYLPQMGAVPISRASGLTLKWQGGNAGQAWFGLTSAGTGASTSALCRYPASQGQAVLPAAALMLFPAGTAYFSASTTNQHEQRVGTWQISTTASFNATFDTGASASGQFTLN